MTSVLRILFGLAMAVVGIGAVRLLILEAIELVRILGTSDTSPSKIGDGLCRVDGTVEADELVEAPLSGEPCVGYVVGQELYYETRLLFKRWHDGPVDGTFAPFFLRDDTGRIPVDVSGTVEAHEDPYATGLDDFPGSFFSDFQLDVDEQTERYDPDQEPPAGLSDELGPLNTDYPHRYREWRIEPDDSVWMVGTASSRESGKKLTADGSFVLSERSFARAVLAYLVRLCGWGFVSLTTLVTAGFIGYQAFL